MTNVNGLISHKTVLGEYKCGPASKYAILHGEIGMPYDTGFVFGETSSQRFSWTKDPSTGDYVISGPSSSV